MPSLLAYRPLRLLCDLANPNYVREQRTKIPPVFVVGSPARVQLALAIDGAVCSDLAAIATSITVELRASSDPTEVAFASETVAAAQFDDTLTQAGWEAKTAQHAEFSFAAAEMDQDAGEKWLLVFFTKSNGERVVAAFGRCRFTDEGAVSDSAGEDPESDYYTDAEMIARFLGAAIDSANSKRRLDAIGAGAEFLAVVFTTPFASAPSTIQARVRTPGGSGAVIPCVVDHSTVTAAGFTARFIGPTPDALHQLDWWAIL